MAFTTVTLGTGAAALAGAVGVGLAGLLGAGLVAGALGNRNRGGGGGRRSGRRSGRRQGNRGYRRGRRALTTQEEEEIVDQKIDNLFELIRADDTTGCGLRLVCELSGKDQHDLTDTDLAILDLVNAPVKPGEDLRAASRLEYGKAAALGQTESNCAAAFSLCPVDSNVPVMDVVETLYLP